MPFSTRKVACGRKRAKVLLKRGLVFDLVAIVMTTVTGMLHFLKSFWGLGGTLDFCLWASTLKIDSDRLMAVRIAEKD
jgi:hypothetical protein